MKAKNKNIRVGGVRYDRWDILNMTKFSSSANNDEKLVKILLSNRKIKSKKQIEEFYNPKPPKKLTMKEVEIDSASIGKVIKRVKKAKSKKEKVIIYGDYDADGVCASAILWETLFSLGLDVLPHLPERFTEGYGINPESVEKLHKKYPKLGLIITVDNGIVAYDGVNKANELGIDVIVSDHHVKEKKLPKSFAVIHTTKLSGAAVSWIMANEIRKKMGNEELKSRLVNDGLDLAAIGIVADQIPLVGVARSFVKYGLETLNGTKRPGLLALFQVASIKRGSLGTYEINFMLAPRINAMGRLEHAIDSLRLLCTKSTSKAEELAVHLNKVNMHRQKIVEEVVIKARKQVEDSGISKVIVISDSSYHEGVIGLAASKLVEEFYRPSIVISEKGEVAKASARSISGFNIIDAIRSVDNLIEGGGGHPMAAGFSIKKEMIASFSKSIVENSKALLTDEVLSKKITMDIELQFDLINMELVNQINNFEPFGIGNYQPSFVTKSINVINSRPVGRDSKHLKLTLENQGKIIDAIAFNFGDLFTKLLPGVKIDAAYFIEKNVWNGTESLQLRIRDVNLD